MPLAIRILRPNGEAGLLRNIIMAVVDHPIRQSLCAHIPRGAQPPWR
jgi:hypothetical protein